MVGIPLALTGEYEHPQDGEFATVLIRLNGLPLLRLRTDTYVPPHGPASREHNAVLDAVMDFAYNVAGLAEGAEPA